MTAVDTRFLFRLALIAMAMFISVMMIYVFSSLSATLAISAVCYLILDTPVRFLEHRGVRRALCVFVVLLSAGILIFGGLLVVGPFVVSDLKAISGGFPMIRERISDLIPLLNDLVPGSGIGALLTPQRIAQLQFFFLSLFTEIIQTSTTWALNVTVVIPLLTVTMLLSAREIKSALLSLIPNSYFETTMTILDQVVRSIREYVVARFLESVGVALICIAGFALIGLPGALVLGITAGILNLIPYVGPLMSLIPPVLMAFTVEGTSLVVWAVVVIGVAQFVDNVLFQPVLVSKIVDVHPLLVLILTAIGADLAGPMGMVVCIPLYAIAKILIKNIYEFLQSVKRRSSMELVDVVLLSQRTP